MMCEVYFNGEGKKDLGFACIPRIGERILYNEKLYRVYNVVHVASALSRDSLAMLYVEETIK